MKKYFLLAAVICCLENISAQNLVTKKDTGGIGGAKYQILFPANWKGKLVMYAHGYQNVGFPSQSNNPNFLIVDTIKAPVVAIIAEGDLVVISFAAKLPEPTDSTKTYTTTWFDMFRIENGKLAEHWDGAPKTKNQ